MQEQSAGKLVSSHAIGHEVGTVGGRKVVVETVEAAEAAVVVVVVSVGFELL